MMNVRGRALALSATAAVLAACGGGEDVAERIVVRGTGSGSVTCSDAPGAVVPVSFDGALKVGTDESRVVDRLREISVAFSAYYPTDLLPPAGERLAMSLLYKVPQGWQRVWVWFGANGVMTDIVFGRTVAAREDVPEPLSATHGATKLCRAAGTPQRWNNDPALVGDVRSIYLAIVERPTNLPSNKITCHSEPGQPPQTWEARVSIVDSAIRVTPPPGATAPIVKAPGADYLANISTVKRDWSVHHAWTYPGTAIAWGAGYTLASSGRITGVKSAGRAGANNISCGRS